MRLSILVPSNEVESIPLLKDALLDTLTGMPHEFKVTLTNGGSKELLDQIAADDHRLRVVHFRRNYGQTAALMAANSHSTGDILIPVDGDLQNDPKGISGLLDKLNEGHDVVSGWRKNRQDKAVSRKLPSKVANWIISRNSGVALYDYGCTLKAYRRSVLENVRLYGEMYRFIPVYAAWGGASIAEMVVSRHPRRRGVSKYGLGRIPKVIFDLVLI